MPFHSWSLMFKLAFRAFGMELATAGSSGRKKGGERRWSECFGIYLASFLLPNKTRGNWICLAGIIQSESFDVRVRRDALGLGS